MKISAQSGWAVTGHKLLKRLVFNLTDTFLSLTFKRLESTSTLLGISTHNESIEQKSGDIIFALFVNSKVKVP